MELSLVKLEISSLSIIMVKKSAYGPSIRPPLSSGFSVT